MKDFVARLLMKYPAIAATLAVTSTCGGRELVDRNPVLLIHGLHDSARSMRLMESRLTHSGWNVFTVSLVPSDGSVPLQELAKQIEDYVDRTFRADRKIDIVAFSMGGVVARYYVQCMGGARHVDRLITISAPNHGSWLAYLSRKPGCVQMRPCSAFLVSLNRDLAPLRRVRFMSIWSPLDLMIVPSSSSRMTIGRQTKIWTLAHPLMILQRHCLKPIERFLAEPNHCSDVSGRTSPRLNMSM